jgi:hypothetical protein
VSEFHKADYHNLCHLIAKPYVEVSALDYEGIATRNPITKKRIFVDGEDLLKTIRNFVG